MEKLLKVLHGKKLLLGGVVSAVATYLLSRGTIGLQEVELVNSVMIAIGIGDVVATSTQKK